MCTTSHTHFDTILHSGEWPAIKAKLAETNPFANLPYVLDGETVVSQSNACLVYLAGRFGALHPPSPLTVLICLRLKPK
jgi:glutathione S-transferase